MTLEKNIQAFADKKEENPDTPQHGIIDLVKTAKVILRSIRTDPSSLLSLTKLQVKTEKK